MITASELRGQRTCDLSMTSSLLLRRELLVIVLALQRVMSSLYGGDYCDTETFRAECGSNEVVLMHSARYGRMSIGRCVETEMGHIGCYRDVLAATDRRCSGRRRCEIHIPDAEFESTRPCLRELKSYLEASYTCLPVTNRTAEFCRRHSELRATPVSPTLSMTSSTVPTAGYVASVVTSDAPVCARLPWIVEVPAGQQINLTLLDFTTNDGHQHPTSAAASLPPVSSTAVSASALGFKKARKTEPEVDAGDGFDGDVIDEDSSCRKYAVVQDGDRRITLCGGNQRMASSYLSQSSAVRLWITAGVAPTDMQRFVIQYTAVGCADPHQSPDSDTWFRRVSDDRANFGCRHSDVSWSVVCRDRKWIGAHRNCTSGINGGSGSARRHATRNGGLYDQSFVRSDDSQLETPHNLLVAVLTLFTITVAFILVLVIIGLVQRCVKLRRRSATDKLPSQSTLSRDDDHTPADRCSSSSISQSCSRHLSITTTDVDSVTGAPPTHPDDVDPSSPMSLRLHVDDDVMAGLKPRDGKWRRRRRQRRIDSPVDDRWSMHDLSAASAVTARSTSVMIGCTGGEQNTGTRFLLPPPPPPPLATISPPPSAVRFATGCSSTIARGSAVVDV